MRRHKARPSGLAFIIPTLLILGACSSELIVPFAGRAVHIADQHRWQSHITGTREFPVQAFTRPFVKSDHLTIYLEGDGNGWISLNQLSPDPTPITPYALKLAVRHPPGNVGYLARPCQYNLAVSPGCAPRYWGSDRYAPEIVEVMASAVHQLKSLAGAKFISLVGFSGGGTIAALLAFYRDDVVQLTTISSNLDHTFWTSNEKLTPLVGSFNAADIANDIAHIPQRHFIGGKDDIVPPSVVESFVAKISDRSRTKIIRIENFDHECCWLDQWPVLLKR